MFIPDMPTTWTADTTNTDSTNCITSSANTAIVVYRSNVPDEELPKSEEWDEYEKEPMPRLTELRWWWRFHCRPEDGTTALPKPRFKGTARRARDAEGIGAYGDLAAPPFHFNHGPRLVAGAFLFCPRRVSFQWMPRKKPPPKRGRGRPSSFTAKVKKDILWGLKNGMSKKDSAELAGVHHTTVCAWVAQGEKAGKGEYFEFSEKYKRAALRSEGERNRLIALHGKKHWQALAWLQERTIPSRYSRRTMVQGAGPVPHEDLEQPEPKKKRGSGIESKDDSLAFWRSIRDNKALDMDKRIKAQERIDVLCGFTDNQRDTDDATSLAGQVIEAIQVIELGGGPAKPEEKIPTQPKNENGNGNGGGNGHS